MKQEVNAADVKAMNRDAIIFSILLAATIILPVPLIKWFGLYGLIPELLLWGSAMYFALRLERIKKANNVQSYKEILAFSEGRKLDEIEQKVEAGQAALSEASARPAHRWDHTACRHGAQLAAAVSKHHKTRPDAKASGRVCHLEASFTY